MPISKGSILMELLELFSPSSKRAKRKAKHLELKVDIIQKEGDRSL